MQSWDSLSFLSHGQRVPGVTVINVQRGLICRLCVHGRAYIGKAPKVVLHNFEDCVNFKTVWNIIIIPRDLVRTC